MSLSLFKNLFFERKTGMDVLLAYDGSDNLEYVGFAKAGTASSAKGWSIIKLAYTGTLLTSVKYANGDPTNSHVWDDRAGYSY